MDSASAHAKAVTVRVGVYHNPPKLMLDEKGAISGIFGDLLTEIARRENWQIKPVSCHWEDCLNLLEQGQLDLMPDVAINADRSNRFQFHDIPALMSWSQVYTADGLRLSTLLDLEGKRVAILKGSIQQDYLQRLVNSFALDLRWIEVDTLDAAFKAVVEGKADAVVASHFYGNWQLQRLALNPSPIMFQPSQLYFAAPDTEHAAMLQVIDSYLARWKNYSDSIYFRTLDKWAVPGKKMLPAWLGWSLAALILAVAIVIAFNWVLRRRIASKTCELAESERRLTTILDSVEACVYIKDRQHRYLYVNDKVSGLAGLKPDALLGESDNKLFDDETAAKLMHNDLRVLEMGERLVEEEITTLASTGEQRHFLSVKIPLRDADNQIYALCGISSDISENKRVQQRLQSLEFSDPLTGLSNRFELFRIIDNEIGSVSPAHAEGALLLIDIDDFKLINESRSHMEGDELLTQLAQRLLSHTTQGETIARISSDEFACLIPVPDKQLPNDFLKQRATELRQLLSETYQLTSGSYTATVCVGIAKFSDAEGQPERLLRLADLALNEAKHQGRNNQRFFDQQMQEAINRRSVLEVALRSAIVQDQLSLYLQPQVDKSGQVIGMEALLRWHDSAMGSISPAEFIAIAEDSGIIIQLGQWVLEKACAILADWALDPVKSSWVLAVNISPRQFRHAGFVSHIEDTVRRSGIQASRLELEVTENLLIDNPEQVAARMKQLRLLGVQFSLDDFGTGYASLSYLKLLPIHQLKIDQSFVRDVLINSNDEAIVKTILALGASLELEVIAEGVETKAQVVRLKELGCELFQGYFFGVPSAATDYMSANRDHG
jgi:diguanylate cyclase (GGDEF)-like protein/PAS domain S-box-containing protein